MKNLQKFKNDSDWGTFYFKDKLGHSHEEGEHAHEKAEKKDQPLTKEELQEKIKKAVKDEKIRKDLLNELTLAGKDKKKFKILNEKIQKILDNKEGKGFDSKEKQEGGSLTQENLFKSFSDEEKGGIRDSSLYSEKDFKGKDGKYKENNISFSSKEDLKNIGAGDLYPSSVRQLSIDGKLATRKGPNGGFFYPDGKYAKIVKGTKVKVMKEASSSEYLAMQKEFKNNEKAFKAEFGEKGQDITINGKKQKTGSLVAKMAARYDIDPHLLMDMSDGISPSDPKAFMNALNMKARSIQKKIESGGGNKEDAYTTKNGRRFLKAKYLRKFMGGNKENIAKYLKSSGANYEGVKGPDGKVMKHEDVIKGLEKKNDLSKISGNLSKTLTPEEDENITEFLIGKMKGSTRENIKALSSPAKRMAHFILSQEQFKDMYLSSSTRDEHHNKKVGGATGSDHQFGTGFDLNGKGKYRALAALKKKYGNNVFAMVHGQGSHLHASYRPNSVRVANLGAHKLKHKGDVRTAGYTDKQLQRVGVLNT